MTAKLERILLIEDDARIRTVAKMALELVGGFKVRDCGSGAEALAVVEQVIPQLILLDVMMPGMDGPTVLSRLRASPATARIPVVFMTARAQPGEIEQFRTLGALDVIPKPFDAMTLATTVNGLWQRHSETHGET
jgi:CheY-like chemotaxis protein